MQCARRDHGKNNPKTNELDQVGPRRVHQIRLDAAALRLSETIYTKGIPGVHNHPMFQKVAAEMHRKPRLCEAEHSELARTLQALCRCPIRGANFSDTLE